MRTRSSNIKKFLMFALVPLVMFTLVLVIPFAQGVFYTFTDWNGGSSFDSFVGLDNYIASFQDGDFWQSMGITLAYVAACLVLVNLVAFGLALLVTIPMRGVNGLRTAFFVPNLIGGVILGLIWQFLFGQAFVKLLPSIFNPNWLLDTTTAFWAMVIVTVWQMSGYMMIIYVTALMSIDPETMEASNLDGASGLKALLFIKIPLIAQAFTISLFLTLRNAFMAYDVNLALTGGGPFRSTELISLRVFTEAFGFGNFDTGQAQAVLMFILVALAAVTQVAVAKRFEVQR
ncbi:carbohydrate ABC transporter permease [Demequina sp.]|uniref:carbohydrate ABC transporter permease n=1 Tax=Demequina sp. TaxID=2050685 RepID=UPI0025F816E8|nr:sugar ABC transporter permease [Demequina sp.]